MLSLRKSTMVRTDSKESESSIDIPTTNQCNSSNQSFVIPATQYIESASVSSFCSNNLNEMHSQ
jgi:hypothetical protein